MQTNTMNLESKVGTTRLTEIGKDLANKLKNKMYSARTYAAIGVAAIGLSIGAAGCDSGGDDDGTYSDSSGCSHNHGGRAGYMEEGCIGGYYCECKEVTNKDGFSTHRSCSCVPEDPNPDPCNHCY